MGELPRRGDRREGFGVGLFRSRGGLGGLGGYGRRLSCFGRCRVGFVGCEFLYALEECSALLDDCADEAEQSTEVRRFASECTWLWRIDVGVAAAAAGTAA